MEKVSSAWYHSLAPEGTGHVRRKALLCQVAKGTCTASDTQPGQNATSACALYGPQHPSPHWPLPDLNARISAKPLRLCLGSKEGASMTHPSFVTRS